MGSADEVNIQASELNRTMNVSLEQACKEGILCVRSFKHLQCACIIGQWLGLHSMRIQQLLQHSVNFVSCNSSFSDVVQIETLGSC